MVIGVPRELQPGEHRAAMIPASVQKLVRAGADVVIESGLGLGAGHSDEDYATAGAHVSHDRAALLARSDLVLRLRKPPVAEIAQLKRGAIHISYLDPFNETALVEAFAAAGVSAISMEMIPRTTLRAEDGRAQLAGATWRATSAVILAAARLDRDPADDDDAGGHHRRRRSVFVIGAGVAGLQAIATAKRLGARVEAFDTRAGGRGAGAVAGREVRRRSISARPARPRTATRRQLTAGAAGKAARGPWRSSCAESDVVITTAQVFGRKRAGAGHARHGRGDAARAA